MNTRQLRVISYTGAALLLFSITAWALPRGEVVVSGNSTVTRPNAQSLHVSQTSEKSIINWQNYGIGAGETVRYFQPTGNALSLNRVIGVDPTVIHGQLRASGQVWVINPNGLLVGSGARINVGSFLGSTLGIGDEDFLSGNTSFLQSGPLSSLIHRGSLCTRDGGYAVLLAPSIINEGEISSPGGTAYLAAGSRVTLGFSDNDLISLSVDKEAAEAALGISNQGLIRAPGGEVGLYAGMASDGIKTVINNQGIIEAAGIEEKSGKIFLVGGMETNRVIVGGRLDASAPDTGDGGFIETSAAEVRVTKDAVITTEASTGNTGTWLIDPGDYTIAPSGGDQTGADLSAQLNTTSIIVQTSGAGTGNGDIFVNDEVNWATDNTLTFNAHRNININADITATGDNAGLVLTPNFDADASGGTYTLNSGAVITLSGAAPGLTISGQNYTVINHHSPGGSLSALQAVELALDGKYFMGEDIDAALTATWNPDGSGGYYGFDPIGDEFTEFTGDFDGGGHTISGLYINREITDCVALFARLQGTVRNIGLDGGSVTGNGFVSGLVGLNEFGTIINAHNTGIVYGTAVVGGLVGWNFGEITRSYNTGSVEGTDGTAGGLVGFLGGFGVPPGPGTIENCYSTGSVTGGERVGGLVGETENATAVTNSYSTGSVTGTELVGGLIGWNISTPLEGTYSTGNVTGSGNSVGGLAGRCDGGTIANSFSVGNVSGKQRVGGLLGANYGAELINTYSTGGVSGEDLIGGLMGYGLGWRVTDSFWDTQTSGLSSSVGGIGRTTVEMKQLETFQNPGWAIDDAGGTGTVWRIYEGETYPLLRNFLLPASIIRVNDAVKTYDGTSYAGGNGYAIPGADPGHIFYAGTAQGAVNAGNYSLTVYSDQQGYDLSGDRSAGLTITPKALNVRAEGQNKVYDGTRAASADYSDDRMAGDILSIFATPLFDDKNAGPGKTITITGITLEGADAGNYTVNDRVTAVADISPVSLTLDGLSADNKVYDGNAIATILSYGSFSGLLGGDGVWLDTDGAEAIFDSKNVGTGKTVSVEHLSLTGRDAVNYTMDRQVTQADITPRNLTVTAAGQDKVYDGTRAATAIYADDRVAGDILNISGTAAFDDKSAGIDKILRINDIVLSGPDAGNYTGNNAAVAQADITPRYLTVSAAAQDKEYDGTRVATVAYTDDRMTGDELRISGTAAFDDKNAGIGKVVRVGDISLGGADAQNYTSSSTVSATADITPAALTITANNDAWVYNGHPYSGGNGITCSGLMAGDTPAGLDGRLEFSGTSQGAVHMGDYTVIPNGLVSGNYAIRFESGVVKITAPPLIYDLYTLLRDDPSVPTIARYGAPPPFVYDLGPWGFVDRHPASNTLLDSLKFN